METAGSGFILSAKLCAKERARVYRRFQADELVRLAPGVFVNTDDYRQVDTQAGLRQAIAAQAVGAREVIVTGKSAVVLHGLAEPWPPAHKERGFPMVEVAGKDCTRSKRKGRITRHPFEFTPDVVFRHLSEDAWDRAVSLHTEFGEVLVASIPDVIVQLATWHARDKGLVRACIAAEDPLNKGLVSWDDFAPDRLAPMLLHRKGNAVAKDAFNLITPWSESPRETELKILMRDAGLPAPLQQVEIRRPNGTFVGRVDFMFPCGLIIEYDGVGKHLDLTGTSLADSNLTGSLSTDASISESTILRERERERQIMALGYEVIRVDRHSFRDGSAIEAITQRLTWLKENPRPFASDWNWSAAGKAWKEKGDEGWISV